MTSNQQESPKVDVRKISEKAETTEDEDRKSSSANDTSLEENLIFAIRKGMADLVEKILKIGVN